MHYTYTSTPLPYSCFWINPLASIAIDWTLMNDTEVFATEIKKENPMFSLKKDINWLRIKATDF